jgi:D-tyrosyl-tRNA(Tyr) deacylase
MKIVVQRTKFAQVTVDNHIVGHINSGLLLLVGITHDDTIEDVRYLAHKVAGLRIFEDEDHKMNRSVQDVQGQILSISQFTLYGDCRKGKRPNFMQAARPEEAEKWYISFNDILVGEYGIHVETGIFGKMMDVTFTNWGPVTIILDSPLRIKDRSAR